MGRDLIAVIDDDQDWVDSVTQTLSDEGFLVQSARTAEAGSSLLAEESPDLAVIDVQLPDYSGLHLLTEFRRRDTTTPVIVIGSGGRASTLDQALASGANAFMQKPLPPPLLLLAIRRHLREAIVH